MYDLLLIISFIIIGAVLALMALRPTDGMKSRKRAKANVLRKKENDPQFTTDSIMARHASDFCVTVPLTSATMRGPGCAELHSRRAGDPLHVFASIRGSKPTFDIFSGGYKIGSIAGENAEKLAMTLGAYKVTGAYVCDENCFENYHSNDLRILIFYGSPVTDRCVCPPQWVAVTPEGKLRAIRVCQN